MNENVVQEFEGVMKMVKEQIGIQNESNEEERIKTYKALTEFEKKYLWSVDEKLKSRRLRQ